MNCWNFIGCSQEIREQCPAYVMDRGLECWKVTGTMCGAGKLRMLSLEEKIEFCRRCQFFIRYAEQY